MSKISMLNEFYPANLTKAGHFTNFLAPKAAFGIHLFAIMHPQTTTTNCPVQPVEFAKIGKRKIIAEIDGGRLSSNAGALVLPHL